MKPSRKWLAAQLTAAGALATAVIQAGGFTTSTEIMTVGLVVSAGVSYLLPNEEPKP